MKWMAMRGEVGSRSLLFSVYRIGVHAITSVNFDT